MVFPNWGSFILRSFGVLNLILALVGICLFLDTVWGFWQRHHNTVSHPPHPYFAESFVVMSLINFACIAILGIAGVGLLSLQSKAVSLCNALFAGEIIYFVIVSWLWAFLPMLGYSELGLSIAGATGIGNMGIAPQLLTGYPVIGLVALNLARRRLPSKPSMPPTP